MKSKIAELATEYKFPGSTELAVGSNGELNASSKKDLLLQQRKMLEAAANGSIETPDQRKKRTEVAAQMLEAIANSDQAHKELGEYMGDTLYQAADRSGFARNILMRGEITGPFPVVTMLKQDTSIVFATSPSKVESQITRDSIFTPPEFILQARPYIEQRYLNYTNGQILEAKWNEAQQALMVGEDRLWYNMANETVGLANDLTVISGTLSIATLMEVRQSVAAWDLPVETLVMANDLYVDICSGDDFIQALQPISNYELIMTGKLATLYGMSIISDAFRHPEHRVLSKGEFFCVSSPQTHGQYTDRGSIESEILTAATEKVPGRGWLLYENFSAVIANARSVSKGVRL